MSVSVSTSNDILVSVSVSGSVQTSFFTTQPSVSVRPSAVSAVPVTIKSSPSPFEITVTNLS